MKTALKIIVVLSVVSPTLASPSFAEEKAQSLSDLGQKLQLTLQEANNIYTRSTKIQSDVSKKHSQTLDAIAQNMK